MPFIPGDPFHLEYPCAFKMLKLAILKSLFLSRLWEEATGSTCGWLTVRSTWATGGSAPSRAWNRVLASVQARIPAQWEPCSRTPLGRARCWAEYVPEPHKSVYKLLKFRQAGAETYSSCRIPRQALQVSSIAY